MDLLMAKNFTDSLKVRCRKFYGAVAQEFLRRLVQGWTTEPAGLKRFLTEERLAYLQLLTAKLAVEKLNPLNRASGRFATVFAAAVWQSNTRFSRGSGMICCKPFCRASSMD